MSGGWDGFASPGSIWPCESSGVDSSGSTTTYALHPAAPAKMLNLATAAIARRRSSSACIKPPRARKMQPIDGEDNRYESDNIVWRRDTVGACGPAEGGTHKTLTDSAPPEAGAP